MLQESDIVYYIPEFSLTKSENSRLVYLNMPVTVAERSKSCTIFASSEAGIVGSNPTQGMDVCCLCVCVRAFFCVCVQVETL
jgi:hypothetical protein